MEKISQNVKAGLLKLQEEPSFLENGYDHILSIFLTHFEYILSL